MAEELGQNYKVYVSAAGSPAVFTVIAGQRGLTRDASTNFIDVSSKTSGIYGQNAPGRAPLTITVSGIRALPDAAGLERVFALFKAQTSTRFRICQTNISPIKVKFDMDMYVGGYSESDNDQEAGTWQFTLTPSGTNPIVDDLTP